MDDSPPSKAARTRDKPPAGLQRIGGSAASAGWTLSGAVVGCLLAGYLVGEAAGWNPAATLVGLVTGLVVGFYNLAKIMGLLG